jgi:hypothetical protein
VTKSIDGPEPVAPDWVTVSHGVWQMPTLALALQRQPHIDRFAEKGSVLSDAAAARITAEGACVDLYHAGVAS